MKRSLAAILMTWLFSFDNSTHAAIGSPPTFEKLFSANTIVLVSREHFTIESGGRSESKSRFEQVSYLRGRGPSVIVTNSQLGQIPVADYYLLFLDRDAEGVFKLQNKFLSILPIPRWIDKLSEEGIEELAALVGDGVILLSDPEARFLASYVLSSSPLPVRQNIWKRIAHSFVPSKFPSALEDMLPFFNLGLHAEGIAIFDVLPSKGSVQILSNLRSGPDGTLQAPLYQYYVERSIVAWVYNNVSPRNVDTLLPFVFAQPPNYAADMLAGFARKVPSEKAPVILGHLIKPRSRSEQYAYLRILANMFQRPDLAPTLEEFMREPQGYVQRLLKELKEQGLSTP